MSKKVTDFLGKQAELSLQGKAMVGIIFIVVGIVYSIGKMIGNFASGGKLTEKESYELWVTTTMIASFKSSSFNEAEKKEYYYKNGIDSSHIDIVYDFLSKQPDNITRSNLYKLSQSESDTLRNLLQVSIDTSFTYRIQKKGYKGFVISTKNEKIIAITTYAPIDSIIFLTKNKP